MQCPRCQAENPSQAKFCLECGARLALACAGCGTELPAGAKFCLECGQPVASASAVAARFASPESYTPKYLAERILTSKTALEGERKQVTVLFADLKGSMELLADRDPEDARTLLDAVLTRMMEAVHRFEGVVNNLMGDGRMAIFGAPLAHEDHALRACYAALALQSAMRAYAEEALRTHGVRVQARVGLNSGEVVVRSIGGDLRMDYAAIGQTTHLAARMEQLAPPGSIQMTAGTLRLAEGFVQAEPLGPVPVKGLVEPVEVFELKGATSGRTRFQAATGGRLTRFVGRESELETLQRTLDKAEGGHGQVLAAIGEAGVGKSRLFWEFTRSHRTKGWLVLESGSVSYGKAAAYQPLIAFLKGYCGIEEGDDARKIREKVTGKILTLDQALAPVIPPLLSLMEVPVQDSEWQGLDPALRRQRTLEGVKGLLLREAKVQPLCLVFEDLHWIDTETQAFLDTLVESLPGARVLLLANYRPGYQHAWGGKTYFAQSRLDPLPAGSAEELLETLLGKGAGLAPLKQLLIQRAEGNPFFLEESVRTLVETGVLSGGPGDYRPVKEISVVQVPAAVQAVLAARMDRLPPEEKRLLQTASVVGTHVPFPLLQAIAEIEEKELQRGLASLQAREFLYETSLFPEREFTFKHALTHEVAYGSLVGERKRAFHSALVQVIEQRGSHRLGEFHERLAHHAFRGGLWDKAHFYLYESAMKMRARAANREAARNFDEALDALDHLPPDEANLKKKIDIRFEIRNSLQYLGEFEKIKKNLDETLPLAEELGEPTRLVKLYSFLCSYYLRIGRSEFARQWGERGLDLARRSGDETSQVVAHYFLGQCCQIPGKYLQAIEHLKKAESFTRGENVGNRFGMANPASILIRSELVPALAEIGEFEEAISEGKEAVRIATALEHRIGHVLAYFGTGSLFLRKGDFQKAIDVLEKGLSIVRETHSFLWLPGASSALGYAYGLAGNTQEALSLLEEAVHVAESMNFLRWQPLRVAWLAEIHLLAGETGKAVALAASALNQARDQEEWGSHARALRLLGEIHSHPDSFDSEKAETHYRRALALAEELGMRPLQAHCHAGLGRLCQKTGREEEARTELDQAVEMYRDMGMDFFLRQAEAALAG